VRSASRTHCAASLTRPTTRKVLAGEPHASSASFSALPRCRIDTHDWAAAGVLDIVGNRAKSVVGYTTAGGPDGASHGMTRPVTVTAAKAMGQRQR